MAALTEREANEVLVYENREVEINNFEVEDEYNYPCFYIQFSTVQRV